MKQEIYENLPAITICLPQIVSLEKLAKFDQEYQNYHDYYNEMLQLEYLLNSTKYNEIKPKLTDIYWDTYNYLGLYINNTDYFDLVINNISLPYDEEHISVVIEGNLPGEFLESIY